ncbi:hypothetical protein KIN20_018721 [Parelaphostrongylus tenuis]|uniref:Uncharacterized protein n=1 Tax=Parelaphostrongylus tenuis TaxID=148309 RepID=A0AAD5N4L2_PARTN|nr:hypothetical protein KIN20_018721 [Parelaphostrongylus tenuis]
MARYSHIRSDCVFNSNCCKNHDYSIDLWIEGAFEIANAYAGRILRNTGPTTDFKEEAHRIIRDILVLDAFHLSTPVSQQSKWSLVNSMDENDEQCEMPYVRSVLSM